MTNVEFNLVLLSHLYFIYNAFRTGQAFEHDGDWLSFRDVNDGISTLLVILTGLLIYGIVDLFILFYEIGKQLWDRLMGYTQLSFFFRFYLTGSYKGWDERKLERNNSAAFHMATFRKGWKKFLVLYCNHLVLKRHKYRMWPDQEEIFKESREEIRKRALILIYQILFFPAWIFLIVIICMLISPVFIQELTLTYWISSLALSTSITVFLFIRTHKKINKEIEKLRL